MSLQHDERNLVRAIHAASRPAVIAVTGGGSAAMATLLSVPGASRSILECLVPYAASAMSQFLGRTPEQHCSERTARWMAMAAYMRAQNYGVNLDRRLGIAATCSLSSDRPKRGSHRIFVASQSSSATASWSVELEKGLRDREGEEAIAARMVLNAVAEACGLEDTLDLHLSIREQLIYNVQQASEPWQDLLAARVDMVRTGTRPAESIRGVFPGAFNPLHTGHREMHTVAERLLGNPVIYELSILNVDKPPLDFIEIQLRSQQFHENLCLTRAPTFVDKSTLFPGATFVVGVDTLERIGQTRYYAGDAARLDAAIETIAQNGCKFLVFGREAIGKFRTLQDLTLPRKLADLCTAVAESEFRQDISSTQIRAQSQSGTHAAD